LFGRSDLPGLTAPSRNLPVQIHSVVLDDEIEFELADDMQVHELPAAIAVTSAYGTYSTKFVATNRTVRVVRRLEMTSKTVSADEYPALRKFFIDLGRADRSSVVLRRGGERVAQPET
jgi:hypothetical protein